MTRDMWRITCDTWYMTRDMFGGMNILSKFQLPSSYCLWFMILWRSGGKGWLNESMNDKAVYRTAPVTPGLLKNSVFLSVVVCSLSWSKFEIRQFCWSCLALGMRNRPDQNRPYLTRPEFFTLSSRYLIVDSRQKTVDRREEEK